MKKRILVLAMLALLAGTTHATVRTVSNDLAGGAQFATITAAYTAASNSDTILVEGTNIVYAMPNPWAKQLTVIGIGFNPNKVNPRRSQFASCTLNSAGNGTNFLGIEFTNAIQLNSAINNYTFKQCLFQTIVNFSGSVISNIAFTNCVFNSGGADYNAQGNAATYFNVSFTSCIFTGYIEGNSNTSGSLSVDHCLFLGTGSQYISSLRYAVFSYNIFMNIANISNTNSGANTFTNNASRFATAYPPASTFAANTASGNLSNTNPNFTTYPLLASYSNTHNYNLQAGSPVSAAVTGYFSDMGPHGANTNFSEKGEVLTAPIVRSLFINNTTVQTNGTLNVQINATKPTDN